MNNTIQNAASLGLTVRQELVGKQSNVPGDLLDTPNNIFQFITVHETANPSPGANAEMHRNFVASGGGTDGVSFTYCVDSTRCVQILPENWAQYAQGTARGNYVSISVETCINSDGNWPVTLDNLAKLVASALAANGYTHSAGVVVQHNVWYGKDCPHVIRATPGAWDNLLAAIDSYLRRLGVGDQNVTSTVVNGFTIQGGFFGLWKEYGLGVLGLPLSNEYIVQEGAPINGPATYQDFENVVLQWYPGIQARICAGIRKYKYGK